MKRTRIIMFLMLAFLFGGRNVVVYAQTKGSPENVVNVVDFRYQQFNGTLPSFADSDKFYNIIGVGVLADWEHNDQTSSQAGWNTRVALGYRFTSIHAAEIDFHLGSANKGVCYGVDVNYLMNLNNFAYRADRHSRFEASFIAGLSYRYADKHAYGLNSGLRVQWNPKANFSIYVEPEINILTPVGQTLMFNTQPAVSAGFIFSYHKPERPLKDYVSEFVNKYHVALKTNILYDLAAIPNIGIEFHLGEKYSVSADWMYSWWKNDKANWYWCTYGGEISVRRWFGKKASERYLTGHHIGVYGQCLTYDFAIANRGQIGGSPEESLWTNPNYGGGLEYGYALPVARNLNIDFCIGVGYFGGQYSDYIVQDDCYVWQATKRRHWIGPSKAGISLVWLLFNTDNHKSKGGIK